MKEVRIGEIQIGDRYRKDLGDIDSLAKNIRAIGLLHPVVVTPAPEFRLIDGRRRLEAAKGLGWETVPVHCVDIKEIVRGEYAANWFRKDFTPSEAVAIGQAIEDLERPKAKARQQEHGNTAPGRPKNTSEKFSGVMGDTGEVAQKAAAAVGMSAPTYRKAKAVVDAATEKPERYGRLKEEMDQSGKINAAYRKLKGKRAYEKLQSQPQSLSEELIGLLSWTRYLQDLLPKLGPWIHAAVKSSPRTAGRFQEAVNALAVATAAHTHIIQKSMDEEKRRKTTERLERQYEQERARFNQLVAVGPPGAAAEILGLHWPCTRKQVEAAFREKSKEHHPDRGGNRALFEKVCKAKEALLLLLPE